MTSNILAYIGKLVKHFAQTQPKIAYFCDKVRSVSTVALRLKDLRDRLGYSQEGMALSVGMAQRTYANWEKAPPEAFDHLARLASHYQVSADYLLGIIDDPAGHRGLSPEVLEILRIWGELDADQRRLVMDIMKMLARVRTPHIVGGEEEEEGK